MGVALGVAEGVVDGVAEGVADSVADGVADGVADKITFSVEVRFLCFLDHFITTFSNRNGCGKFQLLILSNKKVGCYLFCYVQ